MCMIVSFLVYKFNFDMHAVRLQAIFVLFVDLLFVIYAGFT